MKFPRYIEIAVYMILSIPLSILNFFSVFFFAHYFYNWFETCTTAVCMFFSPITYLIAIILVESFLIGYLIRRKLPAFLGTLIWPLWVLFLILAPRDRIEISPFVILITSICILSSFLGAKLGVYFSKHFRLIKPLSH